jgi:hypothetical protein
MGNFAKKLFLANLVFLSVNYLLAPPLAVAVLAIEVSSFAAVGCGILGARLNVACTEAFMRRCGNKEGGPAGFGIHMFLLFGGGSLGAIVGGTAGYMGTMFLLQRGVLS